MRSTSLRLLDMSDRELLALIHDLSKENGGVLTSDIVSTLWPKSKWGKHLNRCVGSRLAWMRYFGVVVRNEDKKWSLSSKGEEILAATIQAALLWQVEQTADDELPVMLSEVGKRYNQGSPVSRTIARREFMFATGGGR